MNTAYPPRTTLSAVLATLLWMALAYQASAQQIPPKREFRAVWIATINNIDWPKYGSLRSQDQQQQFRSMLDRLQRSGINAVFVQIRPSADAFYESSLEPWSEWLTGKQGHAPTPFYDPLKFMVEETHARNIEFHAWINPYRAVANRQKAVLDDNHITKLKPDWFLDFGKLKIFNPGIPAARQHIVRVVADIISRYDVDGIHFDDYFYPYPSNEHSINDGSTYRKYGKGFSSKADWRRYNVDMLIKNVHEAIVKLKPRVKFGVSPYSVWRNSNLSAYGSATKSGLTSYDHLYADVRNWLKNGWVDYVVPQLYHSTRHRGKPFKTLVSWWANNVFNRHLYIGHATYRLFSENQSKPWHTRKELPAQVRYLRNFKEALGSAFYSSKAILKNQGSFRDSLQKELYRYPALIPPMSWKDPVPPKTPAGATMMAQGKGTLIEWAHSGLASDGEKPNRYVVYRFRRGEKLNVEDPRQIIGIVPASNNRFFDEYYQPEDGVTYAITALDRMHNESTPLYFNWEASKARQELLAEAKREEKLERRKKTRLDSAYDITYEQAAYFYQLAVESSEKYVDVIEEVRPVAPADMAD